jgi:hypothetical protein
VIGVICACKSTDAELALAASVAPHPVFAALDAQYDVGREDMANEPGRDEEGDGAAVEESASGVT